jgi:hypothetical protein
MTLKTMIDNAISKQPLIKPRTKKPIKHTETNYQQQVVEWARLAHMSGKYPNLDLLHCSLNGVKLSALQATKSKQQGMLSGVPDLFLPVPIGGYHGLFIEMKSEKGRLSTNQTWFLSKVELLGYKIAVCYSANEAIKTIENYYFVPI